MSLGTIPIRAAHDVVTLGRRTRVAGEDLGLPPRELLRLSAATYETARLLAPVANVEAEVRLAEGPSLEVAFRVRLETASDRSALRTRLESELAAVKPLVDAVEFVDTEEGLATRLLTVFPTDTPQRIREIHGKALPPLPTEAVAQSIETLREQYRELQRNHQTLLSELEETNSGVVALYAELEDQADKLRQAEDRLRRRAEDLAQANRAKEDFLATLSHELRTPLNAMLGWTRLLRMGKLDAAAASRALETIERNARAQEQLIADILDVSRIVTGKLRLELAPIDLGQVVEAALDAVRLAAEAKGIQLVSELTPVEGVSGDADRLQQVLWNLLVNAIKFTPAGGQVTIRVSRPGATAVITVADSGEGIQADLLPFIFDRFRQGDGSVTRPHGGLGLGLSIVRHIVELHGGTVQAHSEGPGRGSTFSVSLPARATASGQRPDAQRRSAYPGSSSFRKS